MSNAYTSKFADGQTVDDLLDKAATAVQPDDARLSDARAPLSHASTHLPDGSDPLPLTIPSAMVSVEASPTNYTAATPDVEAHLAGLNTALGGLSGGHDAVTVTDTATVNLTLDGQALSADVLTVPETAVTAHQGALTLTKSQISDVGSYEAAGAVAAHDTDAKHFTGAQAADLTASKAHADATGNPHSTTPADIGAATASDLTAHTGNASIHAPIPAVISDGDITTGTSTTQGTITAAGLRLAAETHGQTEPVPQSTLTNLSDITALTQTQYTYTLTTGDSIGAITPSSGGWAIVWITGADVATAPTANAAIKWMSGSEINDLGIGAGDKLQLLLQSDGTNVYASTLAVSA